MLGAMKIVWVPGVSGCRSATQPCATERALRSSRLPEDVVGRQDDVQQGCLNLRDRHGRAVDGNRGSDLRVGSRAHVRSWASVVPLPSNVLHSTDCAVTNTFVPGFTVHDSTPPGASSNGATVPPRSKHANAEPPVPNEFWALGVSSTVVHSAARWSSRFFTGTAPAAGAAAKSAIRSE